MKKSDLADRCPPELEEKPVCKMYNLVFIVSVHISKAIPQTLRLD